MKSKFFRSPTIIIITDRTDLDDQLSKQFVSSKKYIGDETVVSIDSREKLRQELQGRESGGVYLTTIQKFTEDLQLLTDRSNVICISDEAHRSHYDSIDGYAAHLKHALPHATLIAFTGTPISFTDRNTRDVFGDYIDVYDLSRAVEDGATVPVYFEPRLIKVERADGVSEDDIDAAADEATALVLAALSEGTLTEGSLFDENYVEVPGTDPQLFGNRFCDWADAHWRPILDRVMVSDPNIVATVCDDRNGFLPTHLSDRSRKPTGNYAHDLQYCRNGRMIYNSIDRRIKNSDAPFSMAVYRYEGDGEHYRVVRLASVPIVINGRRWGDYEISYAF